MSELPDHDLVRELLERLASLERDSKRLENAQRRSEAIRERIATIRRCSPEFPRHGRSGIFAGMRDVAADDGFAGKDRDEP